MTGETVRDLLKPLIGRSGSVTLLVRRSSSIGFDMTENKKLTGVEVRPDGLIRLERRPHPIRAPVASKNALAIAPTAAPITSSPAPVERSLSRWTTIGVALGWSAKRSTG